MIEMPSSAAATNNNNNNNVVAENDDEFNTSTHILAALKSSQLFSELKNADILSQVSKNVLKFSSTDHKEAISNMLQNIDEQNAFPDSEMEIDRDDDNTATLFYVVSGQLRMSLENFPSVFIDMSEGAFFWVYDSLRGDYCNIELNTITDTVLVYIEPIVFSNIVKLNRHLAELLEEDAAWRYEKLKITQKKILMEQKENGTLPSSAGDGNNGNGDVGAEGDAAAPGSPTRTNGNNRSGGWDFDMVVTPPRRAETQLRSLKSVSRRKRRATIAVDPNETPVAKTKYIATSSKLKPSRFKQLDPNLSPFQQLDKSILIKIFQYLTFSERMVVRRVCKSWLAAAMSPEMFMYVNISDRHKKISDSVLHYIAKLCGRNLINLNMHSCWHVSDNGITNMSLDVPNLEILNLASCWEISDVGITALSQHCLKLRSLDLSNVRKVSDNMIHELAINAKNIEELKLSYCKNLTGNALFDLAKYSKKLRNLNLHRCTAINDAGYANLRNPEFHMDSLQVLNLSDCSFLTDDAIGSISMGCKNLLGLSLSFCCGLSQKSPEYLANGCKKLQVLDFSYCGNAMYDESIDYLARNAPDLRMLNVRGCVMVTEESIDSLKKYSKNLRMLNVSACQNVTPDVLAKVPSNWKLLTGNTPLESIIC